jgi:predicted ribosomally synthesized peptide with nif11-like leader
MSKENLEQFMNQIAESEELQAKIGEEIDAEALIALGAECGCEFTAEQLFEAAELSEDALELMWHADAWKRISQLQYAYVLNANQRKLPINFTSNSMYFYGFFYDKLYGITLMPTKCKYNIRNVANAARLIAEYRNTLIIRYAI